MQWRLVTEEVSTAHPAVRSSSGGGGNEYENCKSISKC